MDPTQLRNGRGAPKDSRVPKIPAKDPRDVGSKATQNSISLLAWQWKRLDEIAEALGYNRNELMREMLRGCIDEYDVDHAGQQPQKRGASK